MRTVFAFAMSAVALLCVVGHAGAAPIYFGHADGFIELRDEFDLTQELELPGTGSSFINFGETEAITALEASADNLIIGTQHGTVHVRAHTALNDNIPNGFAQFTAGGAEPIAGLSLRSDGRVHLVGTDGGNGKIWVRQETNLGSTGGIGGDGGVVGATGFPLLSVATLSNNDAAYGDSFGEVDILDGSNLGGARPTSGPSYFGATVNALTIAPGDKVVIGTGFGEVYVRQGPNLAAEPFGPQAAFGSAVRSLVTLSNGNVAIGLANGEVHVRDPNNITNDLGNSGQFNNKPILALAVTLSGNLVIADGNGGGNSQVYIRDPNNVTALAPGVNGAGDGVIMISGADIQALAVIPEPTTIALLGLGAVLLGLRRRR